MKRFNIFEHPRMEAQAVKIGFSWPAFFFGFFWLLARQLWQYAGIWLGVYLLMVYADSSIQSGGHSPWMKSALNYALYTGYLTIMLIPAFLGNSWREKMLLGKGFRLKNTVQAATPDEALAMHRGS